MTTAKTLLLVLTTLVGSQCFGQGNNPRPTGPRVQIDGNDIAVSSDDSGINAVPKGERQKNRELPQISVIDKLLSIESALNGKLKRSSEEQWTGAYNELYVKFKEDGTPTKIRGGGKNMVYTAMALGVKASDGVLALKARNIEALKDAADQIEVLAKKLGATQGELGMANTVKIYANKSQWFNAFLALGRLQRDVLNYLRSNPEKTDQAVLVIVGGWLQGGRIVTNVIDENYDELVSNVLREQKLVDLIRENMEKLAPIYHKDPIIAEIMKELPGIRKSVDVGFKEAVKHDDVKALYKTFDGFVNQIMSPGGAAK
jgi:hypothetical protein